MPEDDVVSIIENIIEDVSNYGDADESNYKKVVKDYVESDFERFDEHADYLESLYGKNFKKQFIEDVTAVFADIMGY